MRKSFMRSMLLLMMPFRLTMNGSLRPSKMSCHGINCVQKPQCELRLKNMGARSPRRRGRTRLASCWMVLEMSVRVRDARCDGSSLHSPNSFGPCDCTLPPRACSG